MGDSPPPSYSPPRPPPPYDAQNNDNIRREGTVKVSPVPFIPLAAASNSPPLHGVHHGRASISGAQPMDPSTLAPRLDGRPTIIVYQSMPPTVAATSAPYLAFCPKCQQEVRTRQAFVTGSFTWLVCLVILFFFFPLACVPYCLDSCKDVHHYCPKCSTLISIKRRTTRLEKMQKDFENETKDGEEETKKVFEAPIARSILLPVRTHVPTRIN